MGLNRTKPLFVIGAQKTGTSTMVGILNCHPKIFISHEWFPNRKLTKYGLTLFQHYCVPERERINKRKTLKNAVKKLCRITAKSGIEYKYIGDKWPMLDPIRQMEKRLVSLEQFKLIFMVRDIRTWINHKAIWAIYKTKGDVRDLLLLYIHYYIRSFLSPYCLRIRMEDMVDDPDRTVELVADWLDLEPDSMYNWWDKVGKWEDDENKMLHRWWERHLSATVKPSKLDIEASLKKHDIWDLYLPIFEKYYNNPNKSFKRQEVIEDLAKLQRARDNLKRTSVEDITESISVAKLYEKKQPEPVNETVDE